VVFRDGKTQTLKVILGRREDAEKAEILPAVAKPTEPKEETAFGMKFSALTDEIRSQLNLADDVTGVAVLDVDETSDAFEKGLRPGDVISEVGQTEIATLNDLNAAVQAAKEAGRSSVLLLVRRDGNPRFVALSLG
jgi:serine protease Do